MDVLSILKNDHDEVKTLFTRFEDTARKDHEKKSQLFEQIRRELTAHSKAEEEIFYPALKALNGDGRKLVSEALKQHKDVDNLLIQLSRMTDADDKFDDK